MDKSQETHESSPVQSELQRGEFVGGNPLNPADIDPPMQRNIINYFKTHDPKYFTLADSPIYAKRDKEKFAEIIREGQIKPDRTFPRFNKYNFLEQIPAQIDDPSGRAFVADQIAGEANSSGAFSDERILLKLLFSDQTQNFSGQRLADILKDYSTPEMMNDLFTTEISRRFSEHPARQIALFQFANKLLTRMYGRRQQFYTQFRMLINDAFANESEDQTGSNPEPNSSGADQNEEPKPSRLSTFSQGISQRRAEREASMSGEIARLKHELQVKKNELKDAQKAAAVAELKARRAEEKLAVLDSKDPKAALYRRVGFYPGAFEGWSDDARRTAVNGMRKGHAKHKHDDATNGNGNGDLARINDWLDQIEGPTTT